VAVSDRNHLNLVAKRPQSFARLVVLMSMCQLARMAVAQTPYPVMRQLAEQAMELEHVYTGGRYVDQVFRYRLFRPQPYDQKKRYPLIIWLHGLGDRGTDNISHLNSFDDTLFRDGVKGAQFFVLALQCPQDNRRGLWYGRESLSEAEEAPDKGDEMLTVMLEILDSIEHEYPVDKNRIAVVGISSGGSACWELLRREPDRFAAVTVHSAGGAVSSDVSRMTQTPIWAFHNIRDKGTPIGPIRETIAVFRAAGGTTALTEHDANGHDSWRRAFAEHDLLEWLLAQHRKRDGVPPPGIYRRAGRVGGWNASNWPKLVSIVGGIAVAWVCFQQLRSRWRSSSSQPSAN